MTPDEREKFNYLCLRIRDEKDPETFDRLVKELGDLLEEKHKNIHLEAQENPY